MTVLLLLAPFQWQLPPISVEVLAHDGPSGTIEVVRTSFGGADDHLGIGLSALGDVNGDGHPDFIVGTMKGAYCFAFGPGTARVISGVDGSLIYTVSGTNKDDASGDCGDAFGDTITVLGDIDRDGVNDFAVSGWRHNGYVTVWSGKSGAPLATIYCGGAVERGKGPRDPDACGALGEPEFGHSVIPLGDVDRDAVPDFVIGSSLPYTDSVLVSGAKFVTRTLPKGRVLGMTGDIDRDGEPDLLMLDGAFQDRTVRIVSTRSLETCASFDFSCESLAWVEPAGDVDGDGFLDLAIFTGNSSIRCTRLLSGRTGGPLGFWCCRMDEQDGARMSTHLIDIDGDGRRAIIAQSAGSSGSKSVWILDPRTGHVRARYELQDPFFGQLVRVGDVDGDGRAEFLLSDYESQAGAPCGGEVRLIRLQPAVK